MLTRKQSTKLSTVFVEKPIIPDFTGVFLYREKLDMPVLRVALDLPLHRLFDYSVESASAADIGLRVRVPFGRGERIGVIAEVADGSDWPVAQLKTGRHHLA